MNAALLNIMVLDDDPLQRKIIRHLLANTGIPATIETFSNAADTLARLRHGAGTATLIVLDINTPDIDGIAFFRALKGSAFNGAVILVSGEDEHTIEASSHLARSNGIDLIGTLPKPVPPERLTTLLLGWRDHAPAAAVVPAPLTPAPRTFGTDELADALARHALVNHYQPKVSLHSGHFIGVEALVRWQHPEHGLLLPDEFVPQIEAHGLIDELTQTVLKRATTDLGILRKSGLPLRLAVNISATSLTDSNFPTQVCDIISRAGLNGSDLTLEVTESHLARNAPPALGILGQLRAHQIGVSIDDFGTGHSSLRQLREIPFNELKIDRSFVSGANTQPVLRAILTGCFDMAAELGIKTVAEGIEDGEDWKLMRAYDCTEAQGYFISRPLPAAALPAWHDNWLRRREALIA
jgi:EAL domain-containing protein (putative c-di-GMP-specific phosphodiesterase class I)